MIDTENWKGMAAFFVALALVIVTVETNNASDDNVAPEAEVEEGHRPLWAWGPGNKSVDWTAQASAADKDALTEIICWLGGTCQEVEKCHHESKTM